MANGVTGRQWRVHRVAICLVICTCLLLSVHVLFSKRIIYFEDNLFFIKDIPLQHRPVMTNNTPIPKIIHQTWKSRQIPQKFVNWVKSWRTNHPDWQYWFWTDEDCYRLIKERYPKFLSLYESYPYNINRADIIRYFILYEFGGVYVDLDLESEKPLDGLIDSQSYGPCFLSQEPVEHAKWFWKVDYIACNAVMACRPRHPFFAHILEQLKIQKGTSLFLFIKFTRSIMSSTGPLMLTKMFNEYNKSSSSKDKVKLVPPSFFYPTIDPVLMPDVRSRCNLIYASSLSQIEKRVCEWHRSTHFSNQAKQPSYGNHHWVHTYLKTVDKSKVDIKNIISDATVAKDVLTGK